MSYAIIRNQNYKKDNLGYLYRHNERKNTNYSNKDINKENFNKNYSLTVLNTTYWKKISDLISEYDLQGRIIKTTNVLCEFIITSNKEFFDEIGETETKRFFTTAYNFVANYQNLGKEFIVSAKIHNDETTPHMHIVFVPVIHKLDKKSGKQINKIACSEYWKGKDSYRRLQDNYYTYMTKSGFKLERGNIIDNEHIPIEKMKQITNYEMQNFEMKSLNLEKEIETNDLEIIKTEYKRVIKKFNTLAKQYTKIKTITDNTYKKYEIANAENIELKEEKEELEQENNKLKEYINRTFEYVSILFDFPIKRLKRLVKDFVEKIKEEK